MSLFVERQNLTPLEQFQTALLRDAVQENHAAVEAKESLLGHVPSYSAWKQTVQEVESTLIAQGIGDVKAKLADLAISSYTTMPNRTMSRLERFSEAAGRLLSANEREPDLLNEAQKKDYYSYVSIHDRVDRFSEQLYRKQKHPEKYDAENYHEARKILLSALKEVAPAIPDEVLASHVQDFEQQIGTVDFVQRKEVVASRMATDWMDSHRRQINNMIETLCRDTSKNDRIGEAMMGFVHAIAKDALIRGGGEPAGLWAQRFGKKINLPTPELEAAREKIDAMLANTAAAPREHLEAELRCLFLEGKGRYNGPMRERALDLAVQDKGR